MCKHEIHMLMGTADGILCRGCGRLFANMDEIKAEEAPKPKPKTTRKKKEDTNDVA